MITKTIELYKFSEIKDQNIRDTIIDNYRYINTDYSWYDYTLDDYIEKLETIGFMEPDINFSGFCNQGDGASFDCHYIDTTKILKHLNIEYSNWKHDAICNYATYGVQKNSYSTHYSHKKTRYTGIDVDMDYQKSFWRFEKLAYSICDWIETLRLDLCNEIYNALSNEYDSLLSAEAIIETLEANEYYFDLVTGKIN